MSKVLKLLSIIIVVIVFFTLTGCDYSLEYYKLEVLKYPDNLIYIQNQDSQILLDGLVYRAHNRTPAYTEDIELKGYIDFDDELDASNWKSDVDFTKEGTYSVAYTFLNEDVKDFEFTIQVISKENLLKLLEE